MKLRKKTAFTIDGEEGKQLKINALSQKFIKVQNKILEDVNKEDAKEENFFDVVVENVLRDKDITTGDLELIDELDFVDVIQFWNELSTFVKDETAKAIAAVELEPEHAETPNFSQSSVEENTTN